MAKERRFIKVYCDDIFDRHWYRTDNGYREKADRFHAWVELRALAHWEGPVGIVREPISDLGDRWKWSRDKVNAFLKRLEREGRITYKTEKKKGTVIIINDEKNQ
ncbi:MAG: hypothetical protein IKH18_07485 [Clostridia bacterium]|nr:hypothetical protein [Clostridia bacterium]